MQLSKGNFDIKNFKGAIKHMFLVNELFCDNHSYIFEAVGFFLASTM